MMPYTHICIYHIYYIKKIYKYIYIHIFLCEFAIVAVFRLYVYFLQKSKIILFIEQSPVSHWNSTKQCSRVSVEILKMQIKKLTEFPQVCHFFPMFLINIFFFKLSYVRKLFFLRRIFYSVRCNLGRKIWKLIGNIIEKFLSII